MGNRKEATSFSRHGISRRPWPRRRPGSLRLNCSLWHVARQFKGKVKPASRRAAIASTFWDRSWRWSQLRSPRRQRTGWLGGVRGNRRVRQRRSARCEKRGVGSSQEYGVAELGTDEPSRRSCLVSLAWWAGPPPIPRCRPPRATNRVTRPPRRSPPQESCLRILDQSLGPTRACSSRNRPLK